MAAFNHPIKVSTLVETIPASPGRASSWLLPGPSFVVRTLARKRRKDEMVIHFHRRAAAVVAGGAASLAFAGSPAWAQLGTIYVQAPPNLNVERVSYRDLNPA